MPAITIRDVPDDARDQLAARASASGRSLQQYLRAELIRLAERTGVELHPFETFAARVWPLRHAVSAYNAWYLALAERLDAPLVTLDRRLARTADARCEFHLPPA